MRFKNAPKIKQNKNVRCKVEQGHLQTYHGVWVKYVNYSKNNFMSEKIHVTVVLNVIMAQVV